MHNNSLHHSLRDFSSISPEERSFWGHNFGEVGNFLLFGRKKEEVSFVSPTNTTRLNLWSTTVFFYPAVEGSHLNFTQLLVNCREAIVLVKIIMSSFFVQSSWNMWKCNQPIVHNCSHWPGQGVLSLEAGYLWYYLKKVHKKWKNVYMIIIDWYDTTNVNYILCLFTL